VNVYENETANKATVNWHEEVFIAFLKKGIVYMTEYEE
jgi:hypothetical protein